MAASTADQVSCRDCGHSLPAEEVETKGWALLPISKRYRCPQCWRDLEAVNAVQPTGPEPKDF